MTQEEEGAICIFFLRKFRVNVSRHDSKNSLHLHCSLQLPAGSIVIISMVYALNKGRHKKCLAFEISRTCAIAYYLYSKSSNLTLLTILP